MNGIYSLFLMFLLQGDTETLTHVSERSVLARTASSNTTQVNANNSTYMLYHIYLAVKSIIKE